MKDLELILFREPAAPKKRRLHKVGETASVAAETPAAGELQQAAVPPAGERRVEEVMEVTESSPVRPAAPPVAEHHTEEVAEEAAPSPVRAANPPAAEHRREEVIEEATPPRPASAADAPSVQQGTEEEAVDEEIVVDQPQEEEAGSRGADAPETVTDTAVTGGAGGSNEEAEAGAPPGSTSPGAGDERMPSPQRAPEAGVEGGAPSSPLAAPEATASPRQGASGATTRIEVSAPSSSVGALVQHGPRRRATHRRAVVDHALQALGEVEGQLVREELPLACP